MFDRIMHGLLYAVICALLYYIAPPFAVITLGFLFGVLAERVGQR